MRCPPQAVSSCSWVQMLQWGVQVSKGRDGDLCSNMDAAWRHLGPYCDPPLPPEITQLLLVHLLLLLETCPLAAKLWMFLTIWVGSACC
jgi:hypothetical protein